MSKDFRLIDIDILKEFIEGESHDVYLLIRKLYFKDLYMSLYEYYLNKLSYDDDIVTIVKETYKIYIKQNRLNKSLKVTDGKYFDEYLMHCVISEVFKRFKSCNALVNETHTSFLNKIIDYQNTIIKKDSLDSLNTKYLSSILRSEFNNRKDFSIDDVINYIDKIELEEEEPNIEEDFFQYLNNIIKSKNITLNQLGAESLIKKNIYEITMDKLPTKNQLIMLIFGLKLSKEEYTKLIELAKKIVKDSYNSNIYSFENNNKRDRLLLHWIHNYDSIERIALKKGKYSVEIVNEILSESKFDILR